MLDDELFAAVRHVRQPHREAVVSCLAQDAKQVARVLALLGPDDSEERPTEQRPYDLIRVIGEGSQAEVWLARHRDLGRHCALKVFRDSAGDPVAGEEARLLARLFHPSIISVFDTGTLDGRPFIEMELCADLDDGGFTVARSLREHVLENGPLGARRAAALLLPICDAVATAHKADVIHGDIKPENVLLTPLSRRAYLTDFGIGAILAATSKANNQRIGTAEYLAPEQWDQTAPMASRSTDLYMLGGLLLFVLTGHPPHPERRIVSSGAQGDEPGTQVRSAGVSLDARLREVPPSLRDIVLKALASNPIDRPTSAAELTEALGLFLDRKPHNFETHRLLRRIYLLLERHRMLAYAILAMFVSVGLVLGYYLATTSYLQADLTRLNTERNTLADDNGRFQREKNDAETRAKNAEDTAKHLGEDLKWERSRAEMIASKLEQAKARLQQESVEHGITRGLLTQAQSDLTKEMASNQEASRSYGEAKAESSRTKAELESTSAVNVKMATDLANVRQELSNALVAMRHAEAERDRAQATATEARASREKAERERTDVLAALVACAKSTTTVMEPATPTKRISEDGGMPPETQSSK